MQSLTDPNPQWLQTFAGRRLPGDYVLRSETQYSDDYKVRNTYAFPDSAAAPDAPGLRLVPPDFQFLNGKHLRDYVLAEREAFGTQLASNAQVLGQRAHNRLAPRSTSAAQNERARLWSAPSNPVQLGGNCVAFRFRRTVPVPANERTAEFPEEVRYEQRGTDLLSVADANLTNVRYLQLETAPTAPESAPKIGLLRAVLDRSVPAGLMEGGQTTYFEGVAAEQGFFVFQADPSFAEEAFVKSPISTPEDQGPADNDAAVNERGFRLYGWSPASKLDAPPADSLDTPFLPCPRYANETAPNKGQQARSGQQPASRHHDFYCTQFLPGRGSDGSGGGGSGGSGGGVVEVTPCVEIPVLLVRNGAQDNPADSQAFTGLDQNGFLVPFSSSSNVLDRPGLLTVCVSRSEASLFFGDEQGLTTTARILKNLEASPAACPLQLTLCATGMDSTLDENEPEFFAKTDPFEVRNACRDWLRAAFLAADEEAANANPGSQLGSRAQMDLKRAIALACSVRESWNTVPLCSVWASLSDSLSDELGDTQGSEESSAKNLGEQAFVAAPYVAAWCAAAPTREDYDALEDDDTQGARMASYCKVRDYCVSGGGNESLDPICYDEWELYGADSPVSKWTEPCSASLLKANADVAAPVCHCWDSRGSALYVREFDLAREIEVASRSAFRPECVYPPCLTGRYGGFGAVASSSPAAAVPPPSSSLAMDLRRLTASRQETLGNNLLEGQVSFAIKTKQSLTIDTGVTRCPVNCVTDSMFDFRNGTLFPEADITAACCNRGRAGLARTQEDFDKQPGVRVSSPAVCSNIESISSLEGGGNLRSGVEKILDEAAIEESDDVVERQRLLTYLAIGLVGLVAALGIALLSTAAFKPIRKKGVVSGLR